jgi:hypothetical protein
VPDLTRSRLYVCVAVLYVAAYVAFAILEPATWPAYARGGASIAVCIGIAIPYAVRLAADSKRAPEFAVTPQGFAVRQPVSPALLPLVLAAGSCPPAESAVDGWHDVMTGPSSEAPLMTAVAVLGTVLPLAFASAVFLLAVLVWAGPPVELTPSGVRSRSPFRSRVTSWDALSSSGTTWRASLAERVLSTPAQRGLVTSAIDWYVAHPQDRAAIGTPAEAARITVLATAPRPALVAPLVAAPRPDRWAGLGLRLTYTAACAGLVAAATDLLVTYLFPDRLLAAERAIAAYEEPVPSDAASFTTDTLTFARGWAMGLLVVTLLGCVAAIRLARATSRGSAVARRRLAVLMGFVALWTICPLCPPAIGLAAEGVAGTVLHVWVGVRVLLGVATAGLAFTVLFVAVRSAPPTP